MKNYKWSVFSIATILYFIFATNATSQEKFRTVILTDMTHDDGNSLVRYLYYGHLFDTEAIIVTQQLPDYNYNQTEPWQKIQSILAAYGEEYEQISQHHKGYPTFDELHAVTKSGRGALPIIWLTNEKKFSDEIAGRYVESEWGEIRFSDWIGEGKNPNGESKDSDGSDFLVTVFEKDDDRPIFVQAWGGPITFVQSLYRFGEKHGEQELKNLMGKLHVYGILLQDITFDFMVDLDKIRESKCLNMGTVTSSYDGERYPPGWMLYDGDHFWKYLTVMTQQEVNGHGPMSDLYDHGGEGDTPAFLYLISATLGLNAPLSPTQGSWGSRFKEMGKGFPENYFHTCGIDREEALERWIPAAKNSFLNRLQYSKKSPTAVNHEPIAILNNDKSSEILKIKGKPGSMVNLDASDSKDPDNEVLNYHWFIYKEAGTYGGEVALELEANGEKQRIKIPKDIGDKEIHVILEVIDTGTPNLTSYRRVIIRAK
ncbi:nucleoside hydrolase-like domain-containing protein [Algoriphagus persicinus]|uniref:nucleoside hydrolase-like domain-containing protein n=1 Tax=Algoriphagus persicinus TaxID=3108754 RepID=UPI002B3CCEFF|nr:nucleoside hydrolase-like domain-containing protein [Algoriphagus sp. E1-3-M2]MEB2787017.1 DUF1593 domain-containing protein [Algoriphagus sp. E1-3-M2]